MQCIWFMFLLVWVCTMVESSHDLARSRHKRFVTFPEGSALTFIVCCNSVAPFADDIFTFGLDMDMSWDLPNDTRVFTDNLKPEEQQRNDRGDLYVKLEHLLEAVGLDGRACVLRTMCEVTRQLGTMGEDGGLVEELLRLLFTLPMTSRSDWRHVHYEDASHRGYHDPRPCEEIFQGCPLSLLDLI